MNGTFSSRRKSAIAVAVAVAAAAGGVAGTAIPAAAAGRHAEKPARTTVLVASLRGANEVRVKGGPAVGDKDGAALEFIKVKGNTVSVAATWRGTGRPTLLHIHQGAKGANGDVRIDLTKALDHIRGHSVTGSVKVNDSALLRHLANDPGAFYANLHTRAFPGGALRGQLHRVTTATGKKLAGFQVSVVTGKQIYECNKSTGSYAFVQRDVSALLGDGIRHSFAKPNSGVPQWVARDRSAVTGKLLSKTPNGTGNIPELDLKATQSGRSHGLLAHTGEVLRLNTVGGVAPTGSCVPGTITAVPYHADYVFVQR
ncbi:CHRD domain-containing protein [Streptomyces sp. CG1]|uniref:CHRD domain-containing protein n=1 Tax=Streptomyces sp. CG1 TaxID=1287523 RepID=UPI0034E2B260